MKTELLRRAIHPVVKVLDEKKGLVEYVASDESIDSYNEIIRASGWRFDRFNKNAPFVDGHDYSSLDKLLGKITEFKVKGNQLVEVAQWAIDVPENRLAQLGWKMTLGGFLPAVSVGFLPVKAVSKRDPEFAAQLKEIGLGADAQVRTIYTEQQQIELSAVIIGANPNALAKAFKASVLDESDLEFIAAGRSRNVEMQSGNARLAIDPALAGWAEAQATRQFLSQLEQLVGKT